MFSERNAETDSRGGPSDKTAHLAMTTTKAAHSHISSTASTNHQWSVSASALVSRSTPQFPPHSPISPASPSLAGGVGLTTVVPVKPLYHVPAALYGNGGAFFSLFSTSLAFPPGNAGCSAASSYTAAAPPAGKACGSYCSHRSNNNNNDGRLLAGLSSTPEPRCSSFFPQVSGAAAAAAAASTTTAASLRASVEQRVRRAAQTYEGDVRRSGGDAVRVGVDTLQVARGYRSVAAPSSSLSLSSYEAEERSASPYAAVVRDRREGYDVYDAEEPAVVSLRVGVKRRRGSACFSSFTSTTAAAGGGGTVGTGFEIRNAEGIRAQEASSRALLTSPLVSSLAGFLSPQSPAIPLLDNANTMPPASVSSTLVRSGSNVSIHAAAVAAANNNNNTVTGTPTLSSPFASLLDVFTDESTGQTTTTVAGKAGRAAAATVTTAATAASASAEGAPLTGSSTAYAEAVKVQPWLCLWASRRLSKELAVQLERDADVLKTRWCLADAASAGNGAARPTTIITTEVDAESNRGGGVSRPPSVVLVGNTAITTTTREGGSWSTPPTLYDALLRLFQQLEQLEGQVVELFAAAAAPAASEASATGASPSTRTAARGSGGSRRKAACVASPPKQASVAAATTMFPSHTPQGLREAFHAVVQQWCEVLLPRWPGELAALGYIEWWVRHVVWDKVLATTATTITAPSSTSASVARPNEQELVGKATAGVAAPATRNAPPTHEEEGESTIQMPPLPQLPPHLHLLREVLAAASAEGMQRLFDAVVDACILSVQELLRCCGGPGAAAAAAATTETASQGLTTNEDLKGSSAAAGGFARGDAITTAWHARYAEAAAKCRELLRALTSFYVDPPYVLQQMVREAPPPSPSSPLPGDPTAAMAKTKNKDEESSSVASPITPATSDATGIQAGQQAGVNFPSVQQQRLSAERTRVRQLHYQLLYALCHLCNELPLPWCGTVASAANQSAESAWATSRMFPASLSSPSLSSRSGVHHNELFAAAAQLAAAVAVPLSNVQLPMKGDLLCVTSRLVQQRISLLCGDCLSEREYVVCMGRLGALLAQAT